MSRLMTVRSRKGFTLIELLIALVLLLVVSAAFWSALSVVQRTTRTQTETAAMHGTLRGGLQVVVSELQELYTDGTISDIVSMSGTALTYKAMRGSGLACDATDTQIKIRSDNLGLWRGLRDPNDDDAGVFVFSDDNPNLSTDDHWLDAAIAGAVATGTCPTGETAWILPVNITDAGDLIRLNDVIEDAPARVYEQMQLGLVNVDGRNWLGLQSVSGSDASLIPLAGPVDANGVGFRYFRNDGSTVAATPETVQIIEVTLIGQTDRMANQGVGSTVQLVIDTLRARVQLRNSR